MNSLKEYLSDINKYDYYTDYSDDLYQNMLDTDKKNTLIFLLESIKELYNMNKALQSKNDNYKELIATKDKQIKDFKNEIKELKLIFK